MIIDSMINRRSIETPSVPLNAANIDTVLGLDQAASSGMSVTPMTSLGYPALWRGVNIRSSTIGRLPLDVLERGEGGKVKAEAHPAYRLLRDQPNSEMGSKAFKAMLEAHAILTGGGFAVIIRNDFGVPIELIPLDPANVIPFRENGRLGYSILSGGKMVTELPENILHIKGLSWDGINGLGVVDVLKESIGLGLAAQKYQSIFFRNGASPQTVIELPGSLRDKEAVERFRTMWGKRHRGIENAHQPALLENGAQLKPFSVSPEDAEMLATRDFEVKQIANAIGIPAYLLGDSTRTSFASLEVENRTFLRDLADPMSNWEEECKLKLLTPQERSTRSHTVEFNKESVERPDLTTFVNALVSQVNNGLLSLNEARNKLNMPPLPSGDGDKFRIPLNMGVLGDAAPEPSQPPTADILEAAHHVLAHEMRRGIERIAVDAKKRAKEPDVFIEWIENINDRHRRIVAENIQAGSAIVAAASNRDASELHLSIVNRLFDILRETYLSATDCQPDELPIRVADVSTTLINRIKTIISEV